MFFGLHGNVRRPNTGPRQQASDWPEACRGGASAPARRAVLLFWLLSSQLFISVTDLGGCGLDLSPRMRSRRKRAQRAASLLLITAPQTTLLHSHQVACHQALLRVPSVCCGSVFWCQNVGSPPARIAAQPCHFLFSQVPEMDWLPS